MAQVQIQNNQTGQRQWVDESQLPNYGLQAPPSPVPDVLSKLNDFLSGVGSAIGRTARNVAAVAPETARLGANALLGAGTGQGSNQSSGILSHNGQLTGLGQTLQRFAALKDPLLDQSTLQDINDSNAAMGGINQGGGNANNHHFLVQQLKDSANIASYAVPFGRGSGIMAKILLPGAAVGALQAGAQDNATPESVATGALTGAGSAVVAHGISKLPGLVGKGGQKLANHAEQGTLDVIKQRVADLTNPISLEGGVYAPDAQVDTEALLSGLGIKGMDNQRLAQLKPAIADLSRGIQDVLTANPKSVNIDELSQNLVDKLTSTKFGVSPELAQEAAQELRKELTQKAVAANEAAVQAARNGGVIPQTAMSGVNVNDIQSPDLFGVKQGYTRSYSPLATGATVPQVIEEGKRQVLAEAIQKAHPEISAATNKQHLLYGAANSLKTTGGGSKGIKAEQQLISDLTSGKAAQVPWNMGASKLTLPMAGALFGHPALGATALAGELAASPRMQQLVGQGVSAGTGVADSALNKLPALTQNAAVGAGSRLLPHLLAGIQNQPQDIQNKNGSFPAQNSVSSQNVGNGRMLPQSMQDVNAPQQTIPPAKMAAIMRDPHLSTTAKKYIMDSYNIEQKAIQDYQASPQYKTQETNRQTYGTSKAQLQGLIDQFNTIPGTQTGVVGGKLADIPGLNTVVAPAATEYENARLGLAAQLKDLVGAGQGSGVRVSFPELKAWSNLLPSVHKSNAANKIDVTRLNSLLQQKFGQGLDPQYLQ